MSHPPQKPGFVLAWIGVVTLTVLAFADLVPAPQAAESDPIASIAHRQREQLPERSQDGVAPAVPVNRAYAPIASGSPAYEYVNANQEDLEPASGESTQTGDAELDHAPQATPIPVSAHTGSGGHHPALRRPTSSAAAFVPPSYSFLSASLPGDHEDELPERVQIETQNLGRHRQVLRLVIWLRDQEHLEEQLDAAVELYLPDETGKRFREQYAKRRARNNANGAGWDLKEIRSMLVGMRGKHPRVDLILDLSPAEARAVLRKLMRTLERYHAGELLEHL